MCGFPSSDNSFHPGLYKVKKGRQAGLLACPATYLPVTQTR